MSELTRGNKMSKSFIARREVFFARTIEFGEINVLTFAYYQTCIPINSTELIDLNLFQVS